MVLEDTLHATLEKNNHHYHPVTNPETESSDLPVRHNSTIVEETLQV